MHGADLAMATDREKRLDQHLCADLLATMRARDGFDNYRLPGVFDAEVPATPECPSTPATTGVPRTDSHALCDDVDGHATGSGGRHGCSG